MTHHRHKRSFFRIITEKTTSKRIRLERELNPQYLYKKSQGKNKNLLSKIFTVLKTSNVKNNKNKEFKL